jgi:hypothetical protein
VAVGVLAAVPVAVPVGVAVAVPVAVLVAVPVAVAVAGRAVVVVGAVGVADGAAAGGGEGLGIEAALTKSHTTTPDATCLQPVPGAHLKEAVLPFTQRVKSAPEHANAPSVHPAAEGGGAVPVDAPSGKSHKIMAAPNCLHTVPAPHTKFTHELRSHFWKVDAPEHRKAPSVHPVAAAGGGGVVEGGGGVVEGGGVLDGGGPAGGGVAGGGVLGGRVLGGGVLGGGVLGGGLPAGGEAPEAWTVITPR